MISITLAIFALTAIVTGGDYNIITLVEDVLVNFMQFCFNITYLGLFTFLLTVNNIGYYL